MAFFISKGQRDALDHARQITAIYYELCKWADVAPVNPTDIVRRFQKGDKVYRFNGYNIKESEFKIGCELLRESEINPDTALKALFCFPNITIATEFDDYVIAALKPFLDQNKTFFSNSGWARYKCPHLEISSMELDGVIFSPKKKNIQKVYRIADFIEKLPDKKKTYASDIIIEWCVLQLKKKRTIEKQILASQFLLTFWLAIRLDFCQKLANKLENEEKHLEYLAIITHLGQSEKIEPYLEKHELFAQLVELLISQKRYEHALDILNAIGPVNYNLWDNSIDSTYHYKHKKKQLIGLVKLQQFYRNKKDVPEKAEDQFKYGEITEAEYNKIITAASAERFCVKCGEPLAPSFSFCPTCGTKLDLS